MPRIIFHIDVNNAFLSWSAIDLLNQGYRYDIRNSYAVIGGEEKERRGVVLAKSPSAKKMGVVTGEPLYQARKKCPALRMYPPNYLFYQEMSNRLFTLLSHYTPDIEVFSIDECFLDFTPIAAFYESPYSFAEHISKEIKQTLGFTVNIGIANNKLCAKMASDFTKPDKIHTLWQEEISQKMWPLPVGDLFGIGKKTTAKLQQLGIKTIGDLASADGMELYRHFKNQAKEMIALAKGEDSTPVLKEKEENKGISNSTTLPKDAVQKEELSLILTALAENVALALRRQGKFTQVIAVTLKDHRFHSFSHQKKLVNATNITKEIADVSIELLGEMWHGEAIRLVGIRLDQLVATPTHQVSLFEDLEKREEVNQLDKTVDQLKEKYGIAVIKKAAHLEKEVKRKY